MVDVTLVRGRAKPPLQAVTTVAAPSEASTSSASCTRLDHCLRSRLGIAKKSKAKTGDAIGQGEPCIAPDADAEDTRIVRVVVAEELPGVTDDGWKVAVAPVGNPLAENVTGVA